MVKAAAKRFRIFAARKWWLWLFLIPAAILISVSIGPQKTPSPNTMPIALPRMKPGAMPLVIDVLDGETIGDFTMAQEKWEDLTKVTLEAVDYLPQILWLKAPAELPPVVAMAPRNRAFYAEKAWRNPRGPKLIMLQFDGMTEALYKKFQAEGLLPAFDVLLERGTYGLLASCCGFLSPSIWTTINTGLPPEEHGVRNFVRQDPQTGELLDVTETAIRAPRLWNIAREHHLRALVGGVMLPDPNDDFLAENVGQPQKYFVARQTLAQGTPNLLVLYESVADTYGHIWWKTFEPREFIKQGWPLDQAEILFNKDRLPQAYRELNAWVGWALSIAGPDTVIFIMSDHGFIGHPEYLPFRIDAGKFAKALEPEARSLRACDADAADEIVLCADANFPTTPLADALAAAKVNGKPLFVSVTHRDLPRFENNNVEAIALRMKFNRAALTPETVSHSSIKIGAQAIALGSFLSPGGNSGDHLPEGLFFLAGKGVRPQAVVSKASVFDILPTALQILRIPAATDMPGRFWQESFADWQEIKRIPTYGRILPPPSTEPPSAEKVQKLKELGYIN